MKTIRIRAFLLALLVVMLLGSCEFFASFKRDLPPVIQLYNSALQRTNKLLPNDTLYVKVSGLASNTMYEVECLDTNGDPITSMLAESDANGVIQPTALWYDIGFKWDATLNSGVGGIKLASEAELGLSAFEVHIKTLDGTATDFSLEFFVIYNTSIERPQPIVMAGEMVVSTFNLENAFDAGDTLYVKVANLGKGLPTGQSNATVNVVPFTGTNYEDGDPIDNVYISVTMTLDELKNGTA
ncbi:MAG: hypothetical protein WA234_05995, partial [Rectinemataceae bacterium]